jgi:murein DD-endopeptidase MepM/ murein hydrolase activator NlpD
MAPGVVTNILYEQSWGFLIAIESNLKHSGAVTAFYGHLSRYIDVKIGQRVETGDKIGELGPQESVENGGYKSHLHWGIAKSAFSDAVLAGYAHDCEHWHNPIALVGKENNPGGPDFSELILKGK